MLAEEKKFLSIPKALGLFMIFKALFYRDAFAGFESQTPLQDYCLLIGKVDFYLFIILGCILCFHHSKALVYTVSLALSLTLLGGIYIIVDEHSGPLKSSFIIGSHICLLFALYWSSSKIDKIQKLLKKDSSPTSPSPKS